MMRVLGFDIIQHNGGVEAQTGWGSGEDDITHDSARDGMLQETLAMMALAG